MRPDAGPASGWFGCSDVHLREVHASGMVLGVERAFTCDLLDELTDGDVDFILRSEQLPDSTGYQGSPKGVALDVEDAVAGIGTRPKPGLDRGRIENATDLVEHWMSSSHTGGKKKAQQLERILIDLPLGPA